MPKTRVQAAGEAMAKFRPSRRAFLGGVVAASLPVATAFSIASASPLAVSTIEGLMLAHAEAKRLANAAFEVAEAIHDQPDTTPSASIEKAEFRSVHHWNFRGTHCSTLGAVNAVIDKYERQKRTTFEFLTTADDGEPPMGHNPKLLENLSREMEESAKERSTLRALFQKRQAAYEGWCQQSGYNDAMQLCDAHSERQFSPEDEILAFQVFTLEDARSKAAFIVSEFDGEPSAELATRFIADLAALPNLASEGSRNV